tara:strand:+ start:197 stop:1825 length:1629 start_codon:yes stop_codon:yes gene_type:complete
MKIFFNGWFSGFEDNTNPGLHIDFFLNLFEKVYGEPCEKGNNVESEVLCEFDMLIGSSSLVKPKQWKHTYLFSGESTLKCNKNDYTCVLWGERNHKNVVNVPLFVPYIYSNNFVNALETKKEIITVPKNDVCVIISNPRGKERTEFLSELEKHFNVCYAGGYKNNIGGALKPHYNTKEYHSFVNQFKFIISMENSREDTYITEKIINGLLSDIIPVYWGSDKVHDYINQNRFLNLKDINNTNEIIEKMILLKEQPQKWLKMVNTNAFPNIENKLERTIENIANDIKCVFNLKCWNHISQVCCVSNPMFEPDRCKMLKDLFKGQNIDDCFIKYISPTYKHTITEEIYNEHVKEQLVYQLRSSPMKRGELSLFLNYKANLEYIVKNYKEGLFLVFESDVMLGKDNNKFNEFLNEIKDKDWDLIHIGIESVNTWKSPYLQSPTGYQKHIYYNNDNYIEDITTNVDKYRLSRKFYTRCTDSFIWKYDSIVKYLHWMNNIETNFGVPMDYYMCNFFEKNIKIKHYWSDDEFFIQGSNLGIIQTTLQD